MTQYGKEDYWDDRYQKDEEPFDWLQRYAALQLIIEREVKPEFSILNVGCGNSRLSEEMYDDGYTNIVNIDFSGVVIKQMQEFYKDKYQMPFKRMNVLNMEFEAGAFDAVIDKGTFDSIQCGDGAGVNSD